MSYELNKQSAPPPEEDPIVLPWFPDINIRPFYDAYRVPAELTAELIREQLKGAAVRCMAGLADYRLVAIAHGAESMAEVEADQVDGEHAHEILFRRAVYCEAMAEILQHTELLMRRKDATDQAKTAPQTADTYRAQAQEALSQIANSNRASVALI